MAEARRADLIVVGAGTLGTFHAYHAAQKGCRTLLIERNTWPSDASTRNFGMIARSIVPTIGEWFAHARDSVDIYRNIQRDHDISVRETGSLYLASTELEARVLREFADSFAAEYSCAYLDAREALYRYPIVRDSYCAGALLFPTDLTLDPPSMLARLIPYVARTGLVEYVPSTTVVSIQPTGGGAIASDARGERYMADRVVVCGGADYRTLFPALFARSGLRVCKLQMMRTAPQPPGTLPHAILSGLSIRRYPAFASCPSYPLLQERPVEARLRDYGIHLLFKQSPDGSIIIGDSHQYSDVERAHTLEESISDDIDNAILAYGRAMVRLPDWTIRGRWNGYYLAHSERQAYAEEVADGVHVVTGIAGKGMTTGPAFARKSIDALLS